MATDSSELKKLLLDENAAPKNKKSREEEEHTDTLYFYEDEIFKIDKKGRVRFGLVIETEPYSDDEEEEDYDPLNKGEVLIAWYPDGREDVQLERTIGLADRSLMPGDVVRRLLPGKNTQRGYCREVTMRADVKVLGTKYVIKNVPGERLRQVSDWQRDSAVCLDSWVGSTKDFEDKAILRSACGCRIEVSSADFLGFRESNCSNSRGIFNPNIFYPGNVVICQMHCLDTLKLLTPKFPIPINKKGKPLMTKFTVESVYTDTVWVHWQYRALSEPTESNSYQQPDTFIKGEDLKRLKRLNLFEPCMLQINDRNYLKFSTDDELVKKSQWDKDQAEKFKVLLSEQRTLMHLNCDHGNGLNNQRLQKKKVLQHTCELGKLKKCSHKDKLANAVSKEKQQTEQSAESVNCSTPKNVSDAEWMSDDEEYPNDDSNNEQEIMDADVEEEDDDEADDSTELETAKADSKPPGANANSNSKDNTATSTPRHAINRRNLKRKPTKKPNNPFYIKSTPDVELKDGNEIVTEALLVYSIATVVWQDGTVEHNIPSTQLYPIHHLDNHEFFPGDFVISGVEESEVSFREYGVIQTVDHHGRTARVHWYNTYTTTDEPTPTYKGESEVSVYDLKDHPDFQYRPGTMVIRVANFVGDDAASTAGQIIDNYIDGRVKVWWVDGHVSMCWPQDLFEVGQYDHADWGNESDDSWETESENSELGGENSPKLSIAESHILANIDRARMAIAKLEEIFAFSPHLQNVDVMRKLLNVYKGCRYLDRLMSTNFFHEDYFAGLIERVRKVGNRGANDRAQLRIIRLFNDQQTSTFKQQQLLEQQSGQSQNDAQNSQSTNSKAAASNDYAPRVLLNMSSTPCKYSPNNSMTAMSITTNNGSNTSIGNKRKFTPISPATDGSKEKAAKAGGGAGATKEDDNSDAGSNGTQSLKHQNGCYVEKNKLLTTAIIHIEKAFADTIQLKHALANSARTEGGGAADGGGSENVNACVSGGGGNGGGGNFSSQDDSGNYSIHNCDGSSTSYASSSDLTNNAEANNSLMKVNDDQKSVSCSSIELTEDAESDYVCMRLCTLLKDQLVKCIDEIRMKYYKADNVNLSDASECGIDEDENSSTPTVVDATDEKANKTNNKGPDLDALLKTALEKIAAESECTLSPKQSSSTFIVAAECFQIVPTAPTSHKFHMTLFHPNNTQQYYKAVQREHRMLKNSLPAGVWVRVFEDRMDLLSVMIEGPKRTPYEDGMFLFDIQLGREYPNSPPLCHYISYCSDRLNPNLYEDGKVCVSLLGTWSGRDTEVWGPSSTLLQVIVSIQGLILVAEPYFNEAGYERQRGSQQGKENSRMYNEMVIIKMVQATTKLLQQPSVIFRDEVVEHFKRSGNAMHSRISGWMELSKQIDMGANKPNNIKEHENGHGDNEQPDVPGCSKTATNQYTPPAFPLVPASRGFCITLAGLLNTFKSKLDNLYASNADDGGSNCNHVNSSDISFLSSPVSAKNEDDKTPVVL